MKYFKSQVKSQMKTTALNFTFENPFSIFQKERNDIRNFNYTAGNEETLNGYHIKNELLK
jgi:hypothetical protein